MEYQDKDNNTKTSSEEERSENRPVSSPGISSRPPVQCHFSGTSNSSHHGSPSAPNSSKSGLPYPIKLGVEALSGYSMDDVQVHYNSSKPADLRAHAYAQGNDIYLGPGQTEHLPHEAWHVVQQKQGRVSAPRQMKGGAYISDDTELEKEADEAADKLKNMPHGQPVSRQAKRKTLAANPAIQRKIIIGDSSYPAIGNDFTVRMSKREFNRTLMLKLKENGFKELGTKKMWSVVFDWLEDDIVGLERTFDSWADFATKLWDAGLLERTNRGPSMGPKNLGSRPSFWRSTTEAYPIVAYSGKHRRHIISSSSLGRSIEESYNKLKASNSAGTLKILNDWRERSGWDEEAPSEYSALRDIWSDVHNHQGNLWVGDGEFNSAIGFIRSNLKSLRDWLSGDGDVAVSDVVEKIDAIKPTMKWFENAWNEIRGTLKETIKKANPELSSVGFTFAYLHWQEDIDAINGSYTSEPFDLSRSFERKFFNKIDARVPQETALEFINKEVKGSYKYTNDFLPIYEKWIIRYCFGKDSISKPDARELVDDWIVNCDLDYPYGLVETEGYTIKLFGIYNELMSAPATLFDENSTLDKFMKLSYE